MGNVQTTLNNEDSITIDISNLTSEQRRLLKLAIRYQDEIPDPEDPEEMIENPVPLIVALMVDSFNTRKEQMRFILVQEGRATVEEEADTVLSTF